MLNMLVAIDKGKLAAVDGNVVKAQEFTELAQAAQVVAEARRYAASIRATAEAEVAAARDAGYRDGKQAAAADFAASVVETTARIESSFLGLEARIVNTVMNAVRQILGELDESLIMERVMRRVLADARNQKSLRLRVSAGQFELVSELLPSVLSDFPEIEFIDVTKDPLAKDGTCVLQSEFGLVDGSIDTQLAAVRRGLINAFAGRRKMAVKGPGASSHG